MSALSIEWGDALESVLRLTLPWALFHFMTCGLTCKSFWRALGSWAALWIPLWTFGVWYMHWTDVRWSP